MKRFRRILALLLCAAAMLSLPCAVWAAEPTPFAVTVRVAGGGESGVRALEDEYPGNLYLSLSDLSRAMGRSPARFRFEYSASGKSFSVTRGRDPLPEDANAPGIGQRLAPPSLTVQPNMLYVDGQMRRYYTYQRGGDLYMSLTDVQLMLDLTATRLEPQLLELDPAQPFAPDPAGLEQIGFFDAINAVVIGDATSGEILFSRDAMRAYPIASISKLMTYLLLCEAVERGEIAETDNVTITPEAEQISDGADATYGLRFTAGSVVPYRELVEVMLLASSNEAAVSLAAHAAGTSEEFVRRMNERAAQLGFGSARFYSPNGLPVYSSDAVTAKMQNRMSAMDLFRLSAYLLENERGVLKITSQTLGTMKTLRYSTYNTNPMLFNIPGVTGLKTGSTNRAGFCLAVSLPVTRLGETHDLVLVLLGAETATLRNQASEILLRWAQSAVAAEDAARAA